MCEGRGGEEGGAAGGAALHGPDRGAGEGARGRYVNPPVIYQSLACISILNDLMFIQGGCTRVGTRPIRLACTIGSSRCSARTQARCRTVRFVLQMMNYVLKMMSSVLKMTNYALKMMNFRTVRCVGRTIMARRVFPPTECSAKQLQHDWRRQISWIWRRRICWIWRRWICFEAADPG